MTIDGKSPQVVVSSEGIYSKNMMGCNEALLQEVAKYLQSEVLAYENSLPELPWPPQIGTLVERSELIPSSLINFLNILLKSTNHQNSEKVSCMVTSFSQDLIHGISRGRVVTLKHVLLGLAGSSQYHWSETFHTNFSKHRPFFKLQISVSDRNS